VASATSVAKPLLRRATPQLALLLLVAAAATAWTISQARSMGDMPGAMGLGLPAFVLMWALMLTAMMLPSAAPFAVLYARTVQSRRVLRLTQFTSGYLLVWAASGIPAYGLAWVSGKASSHDTAGMVLAATIFTVAGIYQLTPLKNLCLTHCRSPIAQVFQYASFKGRFRDLRAGANSGYFCLGCCWPLMILMAAFGVMNVFAMVALAAIVAVEKLLPVGERFSKATGVGLVGMAIAVIWFPGIAPGLTSGPMGAGMMS
jgi:predicted metal-binding membrane protein